MSGEQLYIYTRGFAPDLTNSQGSFVEIVDGPCPMKPITETDFTIPVEWKPGTRIHEFNGRKYIHVLDRHGNCVSE